MAFDERVSVAGRALLTRPVKVLVFQLLPETITAERQVSAGVDIPSSLARPTFSVHPTSSILR